MTEPAKPEMSSTDPTAGTRTGAPSAADPSAIDASAGRLGATGTVLPAAFSLVAEHADLGPAVVTSLARVEERLRAAISYADPLADTIGRHLFDAGGKRIRPLLAILASHLGDPTRDEVEQAAVVVELTHLATLYHDDVMDSAQFRRGAPSAHQIWGNSVAILAGDLLFARASRLVSELGGRALGIQARTFERLCLGQLHETVGPAEGEDPVAHYLSVIADKTGSLVAASGQLGAIFSGADETYVDTMVSYGEKIGVAFQLADDVIDVTGARAVSGKTPGTDLREHVPTLPVLLLRRAAADGDDSAAAVLALVDGDLTSDDALHAAVTAVAEHPATDESWAVARRWADDAVAALDALPPGVVRDALAGFARAVVERSA